ncbi:hypothetical protein IWQ56_005182, partial [Coemansia nantahalensis]
VDQAATAANDDVDRVPDPDGSVPARAKVPAGGAQRQDGRRGRDCDADKDAEPVGGGVELCHKRVCAYGPAEPRAACVHGDAQARVQAHADNVHGTAKGLRAQHQRQAGGHGRAPACVDGRPRGRAVHHQPQRAARCVPAPARSADPARPLQRPARRRAVRAVARDVHHRALGVPPRAPAPAGRADRRAGRPRCRQKAHLWRGAAHGAGQGKRPQHIRRADGHLDNIHRRRGAATRPAAGRHAAAGNRRLHRAGCLEGVPRRLQRKPRPRPARNRHCRAGVRPRQGPWRGTKGPAARCGCSPAGCAYAQQQPHRRCRPHTCGGRRQRHRRSGAWALPARQAVHQGDPLLALARDALCRRGRAAAQGARRAAAVHPVPGADRAA